MFNVLLFLVFLLLLMGLALLIVKGKRKEQVTEYRSYSSQKKLSLDQKLEIERKEKIETLARRIKQVENKLLVELLTDLNAITEKNE